MILQIDGISTDVCEGESLQDIVRRLHLDSDSLKTRPLAAQLAGETFTLGYVPIKKSKEEETRSIRRAIRRGHVSIFGEIYPKRPFKNIKFKKGNITYMKKRLYEQYIHKNRKIT